MSTQVDLLPSQASIRITANDGLETYIKKSDVIKVVPINNTDLVIKTGAARNDLFKIYITLTDGSTQEINLSDVSNQPTWTIDTVGINQAAYDIAQTFQPAATPADPLEVTVVNPDPLPVDGGQSFDAFGRQEVSQITTQLDLKQSAGELNEFIDKVEIGTGSVNYNSGSSSTTLSVSTGGDVAICQTFQRTNYQTGKAKVLKMTFNGFQSEANVVKRLGYFSGDFGSPYVNNLDGCWLRSDGTDIYTNVFRNGTQSSRVASGDWNGEDISDVDWSQNQLLRIEFAWLGVAAVEWSLFRDGAWVNFHTDIFDNTLTTPYMIYPNHPFRWEISSSGGSGSFTWICASAEIEGAENQLGRIKGVDRSSVHQNANNTANTYANIGIALDETKPLTFRETIVDIVSGSTVALTADAYIWRLYINPTITGTALSWNSINNSGVKYFIGADDNLITGGQVITSGYVAQRGNANIATDNSIKLGVDLDGNSDIFVLGIQPLGANLDILGSINWRELD